MTKFESAMSSDHVRATGGFSISIVLFILWVISVFAR